MTPSSIGIVFLLVWVLFAVPTCVVLLRCYNQTRKSGFLMLILAVVGWPAVARIITVLLPMYSAAFGLAVGHGMFGVPGLNFYIVLSLVETVIGAVLLLTACILLARDFAPAPSPGTQPPPPPPGIAR